MPLKQATPSGSGGRSRRAAGLPAAGEKNPSSSCSIAVRRSTTSPTVRLAGTRLTRSASCGHGFGPGGHEGTLTRLRPRNPSRGPEPAAGFLASGSGLEEGDCRPDAPIERRARPLIHRLARRRRPCRARRPRRPPRRAARGPRSRSPWASSSSPRSQRVRATSPGASSASCWRSARPRSARAPRRGGRRWPRAAPRKRRTEPQQPLKPVCTSRSACGSSRAESDAAPAASPSAAHASARQIRPVRRKRLPGRRGEVVGRDRLVGDPRALGLARLDEDERQRRAPAHADRAGEPGQPLERVDELGRAGPARAAPRTAA